VVSDPFQGEGVEGRHDRDGGAADPGEGGDPAHPVMCVDDIGRLFPPVQGELVAEITHQRGQVFFRQFAGGSCRHMHNIDIRPQAGSAGLVG
jgi:hypothetical protein